MGPGTRPSDRELTPAPQGQDDLRPSPAHVDPRLRLQLDLLARLVAEHLHVPVALASLLHADREEIAGAYGLDEPWRTARALPLDRSLAARVAAAGAQMAVDDTRHDGRVAGTLGAAEWRALACAGVPLRNRRRHPVGSLTIFDRVRRSWTAEELRLLEDLASLAESILAAQAARQQPEDGESQAAHLTRMEAIDRFAAHIAHDFNNLLTGMRLQIRLLADANLPPDELAALSECVDEGARLTTHLLSLTRRQPSRGRPVQIDDALAAALPVFRRAAGPSAEIALELSAPGASVRVDPGDLQQVVLELVANAGEALAERGTIVLRTHRTTVTGPDPSQVLSPAPGRYVRLDVEDTGRGVPSALRRRIFEPFFTTNMERHARGLGLSTVFAIVRAAQGGIDVATDTGRTVVSVCFPEVAAERAAAPEPVPAVPSSTEYPAVLLVDDDPAVRALLARQLGRHGVPVVTASNAAEAVLLARQQPAPVQVLVADVNLPLVSGVALAEQLIADFPALRVVLISGNARDVSLGSLRPGSVAGVLQKPFSAQELLEVLRPGHTDRHVDRR